MEIFKNIRLFSLFIEYITKNSYKKGYYKKLKTY